MKISSPSLRAARLYTIKANNANITQLLKKQVTVPYKLEILIGISASISTTPNWIFYKSLSDYSNFRQFLEGSGPSRKLGRCCKIGIQHITTEIEIWGGDQQLCISHASSPHTDTYCQMGYFIYSYVPIFYKYAHSYSFILIYLSPTSTIRFTVEYRIYVVEHIHFMREESDISLGYFLLRKTKFRDFLGCLCFSALTNIRAISTDMDRYHTCFGNETAGAPI